MKIKEKTASRTSAELKKNSVKQADSANSQIPAGSGAVIFLSVFFGFLAAVTKLGGNGAPLCAALTAVLPNSGSIAAFAGAMGAFFINGELSSRITEVAAMPAVIFARAAITGITGKKPSPAAVFGISAASYIICGTAAALAYKFTAALAMAVFFRGLICGAAAYFPAKLFACRNGSVWVVPEAKTAAAVTYVLAVCMLCGVRIGAFTLGRAAGMFAAAAAAFRYGVPGGAAVSALSVFAFGAVSPSMASTAAIAVCSGLAAGLFTKKSKLALSAAMIVTAFAGSLVYGMPADAAKLLADVTVGAAAFYTVPEKLYRKPLRHRPASDSAAAGHFAYRLKFAAESVADVRESFSKVADALRKEEYSRDISPLVREKVCVSCRSGAFCGSDPRQRVEAFFRPAERLLRKKGFLTEKELPDGLDHCPNKTGLTEAFNESYRLEQIEKRFGSANLLMRELILEQLGETEDMLKYMSCGSETFRACDETLSEYIREELTNFGAKNPSAAALSDKDGRLYIECFYEGLLSDKPEKLTKRLMELSDRELDRPAAVSVNGLTHLRWHEPTVYEAEIGRAAVSGTENTSGDSDTLFRDGLGNVCILLSDGMGSGTRAAVESRMTVSVMSRLIRGGMGAEAAVKLINGLLMTKSPEEIFSTVDFMKINLFTGRAEIVKQGAAQTFIKTNGTVKTVESRTTPVGIVTGAETDKRSAALSDGDEAVMITDGITEECFPRVRELMLSIGVTAQDCAERIVAEAEKGKEDNLSCRDDKTVYVVKIHKV